MVNIRIADNIRSLRKEKSLSQEALATEMDVSVAAVSKWECSGAFPELHMILRLSEYFGVTLGELITGDAPEDMGGAKPGLPQMLLFEGNKLILAEPVERKSYVPLDIDPDEHPELEIVANVMVKDDIYADVCAEDGVVCGDIFGEARAGDSINCGNITGAAFAGDQINCGNVTGPVSAGDSINSGNIAGGAVAKDSINCGAVSGGARCNSLRADKADKVICQTLVTTKINGKADGRKITDKRTGEI